MREHWFLAVGGLGVALLTLGHGLGLFWAPPEAMMGDVGRILYAHVPTAWVGLVTYLIAFIAAIGALWAGTHGWDATTEAAVEVGVVLNVLLLTQGAIWAKPTWGVYWTWDPRLTTTAVMAVTFAGVLLLRRMVHQPDRRMLTTSIATILAFVNVPIVYMSVKWWNSMHQNFSTPDTVSEYMVVPLRIAAFGMLFLAIGLIGARRRVGLKELAREDAAPDLPPAAAPIQLEVN